MSLPHAAFIYLVLELDTLIFQRADWMTPARLVFLEPLDFFSKIKTLWMRSGCFKTTPTTAIVALVCMQIPSVVNTPRHKLKHTPASRAGMFCGSRAKSASVQPL